MLAFQWHKTSTTARLLATAFYVTMAAGYVVALVNAKIKTGGTFAGLVSHYRGAPDGSAYPKEPAELIEVAHAHSFSVPMMYLLLGALFLGTTMREAWKRWWILMPFLGIAIDQTIPWLVRYQAPGWACVMIAGHALSGVAFLVLIGVPLRQMWGRRGACGHGESCPAASMERPPVSGLTGGNQ